MAAPAPTPHQRQALFLTRTQVLYYSCRNTQNSAGHVNQSHTANTDIRLWPKYFPGAVWHVSRSWVCLHHRHGDTPRGVPHVWL